MKIGIAFQPNLLGVMSQFSQFGAILDKYIAIATESSGPVIADSIHDQQHWQEPGGTLEDSFIVEMIDDYNADIGSDVVYGPRRNWGFDGPDSLGRVYHDEGAFFVEAAIEDEQTLLDVAENYIEAIYSAWNEGIGNLPSGTSAMVGMM